MRRARHRGRLWRRSRVPRHARQKGPRHARRGRGAAPAVQDARAPSVDTGSGAGPEPEGEPSTGEHRFRRRARSLWALLATVVAVVVLFVGVFPTRTFLAQRAAIARAEDQLEVLAAENERLDDRADALQTADEIERLARQEFDLIRPGERPYVVLDPDGAAVDLPVAWPFNGLAAAFSRPR